MQISSGHLTYCTNIHAGENWQHHFEALQNHIPHIRREIAPNEPFGIGLRLSHLAGSELGSGDNLTVFKKWLHDHRCYVFTINGFPYGGFHHTRVKDQVHSPDWTTQDRVIYTLQLFQILADLLPAGMDGGISTSPLSYKPWHAADDRPETFRVATENILKVAAELIRLREQTGKHLHLDIEPEPDGLLESGPEFIDWYQEYLLPRGAQFMWNEFGMNEDQAREAILNHIQLCYDICHFAVGYEDHASVLAQLRDRGIGVGKLQISAALKAPMSPLPDDREKVVRALQPFNEDTYLHQVVALQEGKNLLRYPDLPEAIGDVRNHQTREWRSHFHVPVFLRDFGILKSTQEDIETVLEIQQHTPFTRHMEVETYTWEVLPEQLKIPLDESIVRELKWVREKLESHQN